MNYQWYPGHMTKAMRMMQENIKLIDLLIELVDARIPRAGRNPDIDRLGQNKARLILLNKCDLADPVENDRWLEYYGTQGIQAVLIDSRKGTGLKEIRNAVMAACEKKIERDRKRGIINRPVRAMVAGIPNVGKSTFINAYAKKACTKTGNKPGVTKGKQWIRLDKSLELLDTPGVLWPKFEDELTGLHLAMIGAINDEILQAEELACKVILLMREEYPGRLQERYKIDEKGDPAEVLAEIALKRGCLRKGGEADSDKAAGLLLDEFRGGVLGRVTIEKIGTVCDDSADE
ncbi:MAG: ribosome biogenesis GTPase YlqF [Lachnospiraceae bacterium]|nr:ribosome biogenesis GTPase YlqF [Lachnospiraceae bacterium]